MIKVLVHYKQCVESKDPIFKWILEDRSKIVEVSNLLELNDLFRHIIKLQVINPQPTPNFECGSTSKLKHKLQEKGAIVILKENREVGNYPSALKVESNKLKKKIKSRYNK